MSRNTLRILVWKYLFGSIFRDWAGPVASDSASRLAAMPHADENIERMLDTLDGNFHRQHGTHHWAIRHGHLETKARLDASPVRKPEQAAE